MGMARDADTVRTLYWASRTLGLRPPREVGGTIFFGIDRRPSAHDRTQHRFILHDIPTYEEHANRCPGPLQAHRVYSRTAENTNRFDIDEPPLRVSSATVGSNFVKGMTASPPAINRTRCSARTGPCNWTANSLQLYIGQPERTDTLQWAYAHECGTRAV